MLSEGAVIRGIKGQTYQLGKEIGAGGEGKVFLLKRGPYVAKLYKNPDSIQEQKLLYMSKNPLPPLQDSSGAFLLQLGWPNDVFYDMNGAFVGYRMNYIQGGIEIFEIDRRCVSPKAKAMFPDYSWRLNVLVAHNLAAAVNHLHNRGCIIGDMNCKNILVMQDGSIAILDTDSFDFEDKKNGIHYHCGVGTEDYLAPELQGRNLKQAGSVFSIHTDDFALSIHIFQLLMDNYHPFSGRRIVDAKNSLGINPRLKQIGNGICPYIKEYPDLDIPAGAPTIDEMLPNYLKKDFVKTFDYDVRHALQKANKRTSAAKWEQDLGRLLAECEKAGGLLACTSNPGHYYLQSKGKCGFCAAEARLEKLMTLDSAENLEESTSLEILMPSVSPVHPTAPRSEKHAGLKFVLYLLFIALDLFLVVNGENIFSYYHYREAMGDYEEGQYAEAMEGFEKIEGYKDSSSMEEYCGAMIDYNEGRYIEAIVKFEELGSFRDSGSMKGQVMAEYYAKAMKGYEEGEYAFAIGAFRALGSYKDSDSMEEYCEAMEDYSEEQYVEAMEEFEKLGSFRDSGSMKEQCKAEYYSQAMKECEEGEYALAMEAFIELENYKDSGSMEEYCEAMIDYSKGQYLDAIRKFEELGSFRDSGSMKEQCKAEYYSQAMTAYKKGKYALAMDVFDQLGDYENSRNMKYQSMGQYVVNYGSHNKETEAYLLELIKWDSSWQKKYDELFQWHVSIVCVNTDKDDYTPNLVRSFNFGETVYIHFVVDGSPLNGVCSPTYITYSGGTGFEAPFSSKFQYGTTGWIQAGGWTLGCRIIIFDESHNIIGSVDLTCKNLE